MSSTAEFAGFNRDWKFSDFSNLLKTGREIFPGAVFIQLVSAFFVLPPDSLRTESAEALARPSEHAYYRQWRTAELTGYDLRNVNTRFNPHAATR